MLTPVVLVALACVVWPRWEPARWDGPEPRAVRDPTGRRGPAPALTGRMATRVRALLGRLGARGRRGDGEWVADFAEVVAVGLEAGLDLPSAAKASARSPGVRRRAPWLADRLEASVREGVGVTTLLDGDDLVTAGERGDLQLLVTAWRLAEQAGAGAAAVTASAAASIRDRRVAAERTAVVAAGPRASMVLLSLLPLAGPVGAALVGIPPGRLYDSVVARVLAVAGLVLSAGGWWWARALLRRARRPGRTDEGVQ